MPVQARLLQIRASTLNYGHSVSQEHSDRSNEPPQVINRILASVLMVIIGLPLVTSCRVGEKPLTRSIEQQPAVSRADGIQISRPCRLTFRRACIREYLKARHLELDTTLAATDSFVVVYATGDSAKLILTLARQGEKIAQVPDSMVLGDYALPSVRLARLADGRLARITVFNDPVESIVGTEVAALAGISARRLFMDAEDACVPATTSYTVSGTLAGLVRHSEYPFGTECLAPCTLQIGDELRAEPAWQDTLALSENTFRVVSPAKHFYSERAKTYHELALAIAGGRLDNCAEHASKLSKAFANRERRATALANSL
ncbi:MAG TPA: hypothetical protein VF850_00735 [Gemmatimonadaceae bacterium]